jgi:hypothetical protein
MRKQLIIIGICALVSVGIAAWRYGWFGHSKYSADPAVAELQKLRDDGFAKQNQMSDDDQKAARDDFRDRMQKFTDQQRQAFFQSSAPMMMKMFEQQIDRFLALSSDAQRKEMDQRIDQMKQMQSGGGPPGGFGGKPPAPEQMDQMRKRMLDASTPDQRAKFEHVMSMYADRMKSRGISPGPGGGFF